MYVTKEFINNVIFDPSTDSEQTENRSHKRMNGSYDRLP